jgi:poly(3-hydroxybutyrate) depolymerase
VRGARRPFVADPVQFDIVQGYFSLPQEGDVVHLADGTERRYTAIAANAEGWFEGDALTGGYLYCKMESSEERIALLEASGDSMVYVNGEPRVGDPYAYGYVRLPIKLTRGTNHFLFSVGRGRLRAKILPVSTPVFLNPDDATVPDIQQGDTKLLLAALPVVNATEKIQSDLILQATIGGKTTTTALPPITPLTLRKLGFYFTSPADLPAGDTTLHLTVQGKNISPQSVTLKLRVRKLGQTYKQTFISEIDGSAQYFAVNPAQDPTPDNTLVLSLHGASVEAIGQADAYSPKDWATLIAPTNRRPYGFDWEDWGRIDAMEVLHLATTTFPHDPAHIVLTGHSMGGHGTWAIGSLFPDRFAAIGASAGWISFNTYGVATRESHKEGEPISPPLALMERAANIYDTLLRTDNILQEKVYVLHGDADDNVPVEQARQMRSELAKIHHPSVEWHEQKGAGHWWGLPDRKLPGADCVDWEPMFALFQKARLTPSDNDRHFTFVTINPAISATCRWVTIEQQEHSLMPSIIRCTLEKASSAIQLTTENIARLTLIGYRIPDSEDLKRLVVDGQTLPLPGRREGNLYLVRQGHQWRFARKGPDSSEKNPLRGGPFKQAFQNGFVLVYPTDGTDQENAWGYARARYDAETFYYRGNASPTIVADTEYNDSKMRDNNVILYGNATINTQWRKLLKDCPVSITRDSVQLGTTHWSGDEYACAFVYPKPGSRTALVGVVGGSGLVGLHLTDRLPYFVSGAGFPDGLIATPTVLEKGGEGITAAWYFGNDWKLPSGEVAWK